MTRTSVPEVPDSIGYVGCSYQESQFWQAMVLGRYLIVGYVDPCGLGFCLQVGPVINKFKPQSAILE